jgi:hypothetical protein
MDCFVPYNDDSRNTFCHCERSETIHAGTLDCFASYLATPRNDGGGGQAAGIVISAVRAAVKQRNLLRDDGAIIFDEHNTTFHTLNLRYFITCEPAA